MTTTLTAFATTSGNQIGADAGISIFRQVTEDGILRESDEIASETVTTELDDGMDDEHIDLDLDAADSLLARMGYAVAGAGWQESGGQWAIAVEPVTA